MSLSFLVIVPILQVIVQITLGNYQHFINLCQDKFKFTEYFVRFLLKMSRELLTPIVRRLYWYFTQGRVIVHRLIASLLKRMWYYIMFNSSDIVYLKSLDFNSISCILAWDRYDASTSYLSSVNTLVIVHNSLSILVGKMTVLPTQIYSYVWAIISLPVFLLDF